MDLKVVMEMDLGVKMKSKLRPLGRKFDGKSRVSNDTYRKNYEDIFGKKEQDELNESYQQSLRNKKERDEK